MTDTHEISPFSINQHYFSVLVIREGYMGRCFKAHHVGRRRKVLPSKKDHEMYKYSHFLKSDDPHKTTYQQTFHRFIKHDQKNT
jgi:hypothetical protein